MVLAAGLRMLAELTSSSLTASTSPRRHAPRKAPSATNSATACPTPASTNTPKTNASPASPNHGTELVFSFLSDIKLPSNPVTDPHRYQYPNIARADINPREQPGANEATSRGCLHAWPSSARYVPPAAGLLLSGASGFIANAAANGKQGRPPRQDTSNSPTPRSGACSARSERLGGGEVLANSPVLPHPRRSAPIPAPTGGGPTSASLRKRPDGAPLGQDCPGGDRGEVIAVADRAGIEMSLRGVSATDPSRP